MNAAEYLQSLAKIKIRWDEESQCYVLTFVTNWTTGEGQTIMFDVVVPKRHVNSPEWIKTEVDEWLRVMETRRKGYHATDDA